MSVTITRRVVSLTSRGARGPAGPESAEAIAAAQAARDAALAAQSAAQGHADDAAADALSASADASEAAGSATAAENSEAQAAVHAAAAAAGTTHYADTAAGIAATVNGETFWVRQAGADDLLILYLNNAGVAAEQGRLASRAWFESTLGIEDVLNIPLEHYPDQLVLILDTSNDSRIVSQLADDPDEPLFFGASGGSMTNIGTGAGVFSDSSGGAPRLRSIVGQNGVTAFVSGDEVIVEGGAALAAPTEFLVFAVALSQSNARDTGGNAATATAIPADVAFQFLTGPSRLADLTDTVDGGMRGSFMPAFAKEVWQRTGRGVIFVNGAIGGSAMADEADGGSGSWGPGGTLRTGFSTLFSSAIAHLDAQAIMYQIAAAIIVQGERDAQHFDTAAGAYTAAEYKAAHDLNRTWLAGIIGAKCPMIMARTGKPLAGDTAGFVAIRDAQMELAAAADGLFLGYTGALRLPGDGMMFDDLHYNQDGKNRMGVHLGSIAAAVSAGVSGA